MIEQVSGATSTGFLDVWSWFKAAASLAGGGWALWTFHRLQKTRASEVDISKKVIETERTLAEVKSAEPLLQIDLRVTHERHDPKSEETVLNVTAELENKGAQNLYVSFDDSTVVAGQLSFGGDRKALVRNIRRSPTVFVDDDDEAKRFEYRIFRVGQKRRMTFAVSVKTAPTYYVQFGAWYVRFPFDADEGTFQPGRSIRAIEQVFYTPGDAHEGAPLTDGSRVVPGLITARSS